VAVVELPSALMFPIFRFSSHLGVISAAYMRGCVRVTRPACFPCSPSRGLKRLLGKRIVRLYLPGSLAYRDFGRSAGTALIAGHWS
jgi:hypothetical protein